MFRAIKEKLSAFRKKVDAEAEEDLKKEGKEAESVETPVEERSESPDVKEKLASLILRREVVIDDSKLDKILPELEMILLESDVAFDVVDRISEELRSRLRGRRKKIGESLSDVVLEELKNVLREILNQNAFDFDEWAENRLEEKRPVVVLFVGVNGTGKTTTIAKVAKRLMDRGHSVVLAAGDTFRAGAIEQLEEHARRLGVKIIKHKQGSDPAAVIFDAIKHAESKGIDFVLADTAGRMHTKKNLIDQLEKIKRVTKPDLIVFVDESIAGNDAIERAEMFNEAVGIDGSILTKLDADPKGGTAISIAYVTSRPILFLGVGQEYGDLIKFDADWLIERIFG
ncbi:signal recognition particle-docking protein FtsY [Geoglobus sp.]